MQELVKGIQKGEKANEMDHDSFVYETTLELIESYGIFFEGDHIVPPNGIIADRIFRAAIDLLETVGIFCTDTKTILKVDKKRLINTIQNSPSSFNFGSNADAKSLIKRSPLDARTPSIMGGPNAVPVSPELYIPVHRSYIKMNRIDSIAPASVDYSSKHRTKGTPLTIYTAQEGVVNLKEACRLEGRPDMSIVTPPYIEDNYSAISITHPMFMKAGDMQEIISQGFKVNFDELTRAAHYKTLGVNSLCTQMTVMGGITAASPEQFAIELVAQGLKALYAYSSSAYFKYPSHMEYAPSASLETLWASFVASMALSRNTRQFHGTVVHNSAGPCTKMMMYETAIQTIGYTACGDDMLSGPVASGGRIPDYTGGLDALFMVEVAELAKKLSLNDADFVCKEIYEKYKYKIDKPDIGFSFSQCYDLNTIEPSEEYYKVYDSVIDDIYDILSSGPLRY